MHRLYIWMVLPDSQRLGVGQSHLKLLVSFVYSHGLLLKGSLGPQLRGANRIDNNWGIGGGFSTAERGLV